METVPNREKPLLAGKGALLVSAPRNRRRLPAETMLDREVETWSDGVEVGPPSNVTIRVKSSLNREGPPLPPVVRRCLAGNEVLQRQRTGRVAQVGAALISLERSAGEPAARQWQARSSARMAPGTQTTTKERTGKTRHQ
jgi:hypothetical protein